MYEHDLELSVGDVVQIGDVLVTVVDIDDGEVSFRIDDSAQAAVSFESEMKETALPR